MTHLDPTDGSPQPTSSTRRSRPGPKAGFAAAVAAAFVLGGGVTAAALSRHQPTMIALAPAPISAMTDWSPVAVKGQVAEIFGNKFVIQDDSGRALVETGPAGDGGALVAKSETVTVQGRFEHGFIHAQAITHADGKSVFLGPPAPPPHRERASWMHGAPPAPQPSKGPGGERPAAAGGNG